MWGTIIVAGILVVIIAAILFCMRKDRKNGKGSCGGDCSKWLPLNHSVCIMKGHGRLNEMRWIG
jgi:F0F1-type ATP synthase assembly protein I